MITQKIRTSKSAGHLVGICHKGVSIIGAHILTSVHIISTIIITKGCKSYGEEFFYAR
jgi:hypothetical protein